MKVVFPALCWAVLIGGFACAKRPALNSFQPPSRPGQPFQEDVRMDPNQKILDLEPPVFGPVYFDYDAYTLREAWKVAALAEYLRISGRRVFLSGHASDEGTNDYNLALGARRAQAVRDYLEAAGIPADHVSWVSYGEESPLTLDPAKKTLNRRVEITFPEAK